MSRRGAEIAKKREKARVFFRALSASARDFLSPPSHRKTTKPRRLRPARSAHRFSRPRPLRRRILRWSLLAGGSVTVLTIAAIAILWTLYPFPLDRLRHWPASPRVTDRRGRPLLQLVSHDYDQWRFPVVCDDISPWLIQATIAVEDQRFLTHHGIDPIAMLRAVGQDLLAMHIVSGGSTLTMQLCRMMDDRPRTLAAKAVEIFRALQLEHLQDKRRILEDYLNLAPYGGNIRGAEAAAAFYFGKHCRDLSLAEAALLAGLPQAPSRLRPDRHPGAAKLRRATVLRRMAECGVISDDECRRASHEEIVLFGRESGARAVLAAQEAKAAPAVADTSHAAWYALSHRPQGGRTTIDSDIQTLVARHLADHRHQLPPGADVAIVVIDIQAAAIRGMIGSADAADPIDGQVNGAIARRSPGSALKPFIYAAAFDAGRLSPETIVHDIPIDRDGWRPDNFDRKFAGPIRADEALRRSLNVPAILVTEGVGVPRCLGVLEALGLLNGAGPANRFVQWCGAGRKTSAQFARRAGLSLAVGGIEVTLLDLTNAYAVFARDGLYVPPRIFEDEPPPHPLREKAGVRVTLTSVRAQRNPSVDEALSAPAPARWQRPDDQRLVPSQQPSPHCRHVLQTKTCDAINHILNSHHRRPAGLESLFPEQVPYFVWKTGTSSGRRDAWAIGHNGRYAIGVWVGRFAGGGDATFVGRRVAEPLLTALFCDPTLRNPDAAMQSQSESPSIVVTHPLSSPIERAASLQITSPSPNARFIATNGKALIHPRTNLAPPSPHGAQDAKLTWFLDGLYLTNSTSPRIEVVPGAHELRCLLNSGDAATLQFEVAR